MSKPYVKVLDSAKLLSITGVQAKGVIMQLDPKIVPSLIKKGVVELAPIERDIQGSKQEKEVLDQSKEVIDFLKKPSLLNDLVLDIQKKAVGEEAAIKTLILICCLGKVKNKSPASANVCVHASSGTGKDFLTAATLELFPEKKVISYRRISQRALDYALSRHQSRDWSDYILYLEDVSNGVLNSESVKTLLTANPEKENECVVVVDGQIRSLKIKGKPAFIFTSAKSTHNDEGIRRTPFLYLDETPEQTRKILQRQAKVAMEGSIEKISEISTKFYNGLEKVAVIVPFADDAEKALAEDWIHKSKRFQVVLRTSFPRFLDYVKASAALYQHQRKKNKKGAIEAEPADYENARLALLSTTSNCLMLPLNRDDKELLDLISKEFSEGATAGMISIRFSKWSERWLKGQLDKLSNLGFLEKSLSEMGNSDRAVALYRVLPDVFKFNIPTYNEILQNTSVASVASVASLGSVPSLPKQPNRLFGNENAEKCEICGSDKAERFENQVLCRNCINKYGGVQEHG